ncbi:hypothetical protein C9Z43_26105, partial [Escherichia coli]
MLQYQRHDQQHFLRPERQRMVSMLLRLHRKRTARAVLTGMCYSAGSAMRHGSSSLTRLTGQS